MDLEKLETIIKEAKEKGKIDVVTIAQKMKENRTECLTLLAEKLKQGSLLGKLPLKIKIEGVYDKEKDELVFFVPVRRFIVSFWIKRIETEMFNWLGLLFEVRAEWQEANLKAIKIVLKPKV